MAIQPKPVPGIICAYDPILLTFHFFYPVVQIWEIECKTFSISHKNEDPSPF